MSRLTERFVLQFKKKVTEIHDIKKKHAKPIKQFNEVPR